MKKIFKFKISNFKLRTGFTMIELLIVIAVLGVLAVAVLSAINPIEQINRGRDTGSRSDAEQLLSAFDRFYTSQQIYPWQRPAASPADPEAIPLNNGAMQIVDTSWLDPGGAVILNKLSAVGAEELKQSFITRIETQPAANRLRVYDRGTVGDAVYVCFQSRSGSFDTEARARCTAGLPPDLIDQLAIVCPTAKGSRAFICLP